MYPHDGVLEGLFPGFIMQLEVRRYFSVTWELMEPSQRVDMLAKLRQEPDLGARLSEIFQLTTDRLWGLFGMTVDALLPEDGYPYIF